MVNHHMGLKPFILPHIASGKKDLEVRVADKKRSQVGIGDTILFAGLHRRKVKAIRRYRSFEEMLQKENPHRILPGASAERILRGLQDLYTAQSESLGVLVFELEPAVK